MPTSVDRRDPQTWTRPARSRGARATHGIGRLGSLWACLWTRGAIPWTAAAPSSADGVITGGSDTYDDPSGRPRRRSKGATLLGMTRTITQRELRNDSGEIMRALDRGEDFIVTRHGIPVGELRPMRRRFVDRGRLLEAFHSAAPIDPARFRADMDALLDQDVEPRA